MNIKTVNFSIHNLAKLCDDNNQLFRCDCFITIPLSFTDNEVATLHNKAIMKMIKKLKGELV